MVEVGQFIWYGCKIVVGFKLMLQKNRKNKYKNDFEMV